jgi:hypothetical protein
MEKRMPMLTMTPVTLMIASFSIEPDCSTCATRNLIAARAPSTKIDTIAVMTAASEKE